MTVVLAARCGYLADDTVELLCLTHGERCRYRLFLSTVDLDCHERVDDLDAIEFDSIDDSAVETFLIESLWRLHLTPIELQFVCSSLEWITGKIDKSVSTDLDTCCQARNLLTLIEQQLAACQNSSLEPFMLTLMGKIAVAGEQSLFLSDLDRARLASLHYRVFLGLSVSG